MRIDAAEVCNILEISDTRIIGGYCCIARAAKVRAALERYLRSALMLTCRELTELVTDYLEGRLSFTNRLRFHFHVGMCRHCRAYLDQMKSTIRTLGRLPAPEIPPDVRDALLERFRTWKR